MVLSTTDPKATSAPAADFVDAKGCGTWLAQVPLTNVPLAHEALLDQFERLLGMDLPALNRAKIAEKLREAVQFLDVELARRYTQKPIPLDKAEDQAWQQARALWQALWQQYSACLEPIMQGDAAVRPWTAHIVQRGLHVGKALLLVYARARYTPPPDFWLELHAYYRFAELQECADAAVNDKVGEHTSPTSCYATYSHALLLDLADTGALTVRQIELIDRWLQSWARKLFFRTQAAAVAPFHTVDLKRPEPIKVCAALPQERADSLRVATPDKLGVSIARRLERLRDGASPEELKLGTDCSTDACVTLLTHLYGRWCGLPEAAVEKTADLEVAICAGGTHGAYFRLGGMSFSKPAALDRGSFGRAQMIATLNVVTGYDPQREKAEREYPWETWRSQPGADAPLQRPAGQQEPRWLLEQLAVLKDASGTQNCGYVRWLRQDTQQRLQLKLSLWKGPGQALVLLPVGHLLQDETPFPAIYLPKTDGEPASFVVPTRSFIAGRHLETKAPAELMKLRFSKLLQRGADFERVAFIIE